MAKPPKNYDQQFKENAVSLLLSSGRPIKEIAAELGWGVSKSWTRELRE